jgi:hypothetical protein
MSKKRILLRIIGSKHPPFRFPIRPDTTISDIRAHLKLGEEYVLAFACDPTDPFTEDDDVFSLVMDGERLIARSSPDAARPVPAKGICRGTHSQSGKGGTSNAQFHVTL